MQDDNEMGDEALKWVGDAIEYNVKGGKLNRGITVIAVQKTLAKAKRVKKGASDSSPDPKANRSERNSKEPKEPLMTDLEIARASVLGWSIEYLQSFFLVADDIMDASLTRRGQPCWYKAPGVGMIALNDSFLLESFVFTILRTHFGDSTYYADLIDLFLTVVQKTEFGQLLDLTSQTSQANSSSNNSNTNNDVDLSRFTVDRYKKIVKYKTAYYTFYLPVAIGMLTSGVTSKVAFSLAEEICCSMGEYFQTQDDYLDCFGEAAVLGKVGTDIQDNKCSWLIVQALEVASPKQKEVLEKNYGKWEEGKVKKVKAVYVDLGLRKVFEVYENESYERIVKEIEKIEDYVPREVFEFLLKKIYKRQK